MGGLEIQILRGDDAAFDALELDPAHPGEHRNGAAVIHVAERLGSALPDVARFVPLMISLDHLFALPAPSALGQEYFSVEVRLTSPVRFPFKELDGGPERFDIIEMACGEMEFAAMIAHDAGWPHVTVHRAYPRSHDFAVEMSPAMERAFFAALRDAVRPLVRGSAA